MLTIEELKTISRGTKLTYQNGDRITKWRVNGRLQTNTKGFKLPVKNGLYRHGYIDADNMNNFSISH